LGSTNDYEHHRQSGSALTPPRTITEVLYGAENAVGRGVKFMKNVQNKMDICFDHRAPSIVIELAAYRNGYTAIRDRGGRIRCFTEITENNLQYCKQLLQLVDELRHLEGIKGGIAVSETEFMGTTVLEQAKPLTEVIYSNVKEVVEQEQYIFDILWNKAIPAKDKIKEIEEGIEPEIIETTRDQKEALQLATRLVKSAKKQILVIFSTANAFHRQERVGSIQLLIEAASRGLDVRILTPIDETIESIAERESERGLLLRKKQEQLEHQKPKSLEIRDIELSSLQTKISLLIVDSAFSLAAELKDDIKENSTEAVGLATYSNSKATVLSYVSFFESLWILTESYRQIKIHEKMQREIINIIAHELRTPIQPIIGFTEILREKGKQIGDDQQREFLDAIARNANRLYKLTEDMLDVARIENHNLKLRKQNLNLKEVVSEIVRDFATPQVHQFKSSLETSAILQRQVINNKIRTFPSSPKLYFECEGNEDIYVMADKERLTQVICNLLTNAIEFTTKEGTGIISVTLKKQIDKDDFKGHSNAIFTIKDTGDGIDADIFPRLFSKFATKSERGTGLGLFISKGIIEGHGGQIWAENNKDEKGATFTFTLPLSILR